MQHQIIVQILLISNYIDIIEPTAIFIEEYNCDNPLKVEFESLSIGADNIFWDFGDGNTSTKLTLFILML